MNTRSEKKSTNNRTSAANTIAQKRGKKEGISIEKNQDTVQKVKQENKTGLPDNLKAGIENLSGYSMNDVKVHYNSSKPAQLNAHAYAQGTDIHLGSGQEKHLAHEAWHVVQQKQGRVQPTTQMKGGVNVNNDVSLEREADVMGGKALQAKKVIPAPIQMRFAGKTVQLAKDEGKQSLIDSRMDDLKKEAVSVLEVMRALGENWEEQYREKGKSKAEKKTKDLLDGKKSDTSAEVRKKILKEVWSHLTTEEKLELVGEVTKAGAKAVGALAKAGWEGLKMLVNSSGSSTKDQSNEKQEESEEKVGSISFLNELTQEDINMVYEAFKAKRKVTKKIEEAKAKVTEGAGKAGGKIGEMVGKFRDEMDFDKRMKAQKQEFMVIRKKYELLNEAIGENEDMLRYKQESDVLYSAFMNGISGPAKVYAYSLNEAGRKDYTDVCIDAIAAIKGSKRYKGFQKGVKAGISEGWKGVKSGVSNFFEDSSSKENKLENAQNGMASTLNTVLGKSWSKFTKYSLFAGGAPSGVTNIKKGVESKNSDVDKLNAAVAAAKTSIEGDSKNRYPETHIFYEAIAHMKVEDVQSVLKAESIISEIGSKLGK